MGDAHLALKMTDDKLVISPSIKSDYVTLASSRAGVECRAGIGRKKEMGILQCLVILVDLEEMVRCTSPYWVSRVRK